MKSNHIEYLERMAESAHFSTKQNIPSIILSNGCRSVLDVGCADGSFTNKIREFTGAVVTGIDNNPKNIKLAKKKFPDIRFVEAEIGKLEPNEKFDCVVFCSVMHEISSYFPITGMKYTKTPIKNAIVKAWEHLNPNGIMIIRDGLSTSYPIWRYSTRVRFVDKKTARLFKKFMDGDFLPLNNPNVYGKSRYTEMEKDSLFYVEQELLMEFLLTATWGRRSWKRETKERKLICDKGEWYDLIEENGFIVESYLQTNEEYSKYFRNICDFEKGWNLPETTCLIVARKN